MRTFQLMVNDCVRLGFDCEEPSYSAIKPLCYERTLAYPIEDSYRFSAMFEASNLIKKYRTESERHNTVRPYCRNLFISASVGVRVSGDWLELPGGLRVKLNQHTMAVLSKQGVEVNSVTATPQALGVIYRKEVTEVKLEGVVAFDINPENVTSFDTEGRTEVYDLAVITQIHERYRRIKSRFRRNDIRIKRDLFRKYSAIGHGKKGWVLHNVSSTIVYRAASLKQAVVMENLKGIRQMYRRESKSSAFYLSKMNSWPFAELQRQIEYKARWEGLPVVYVEPQGTSSTCSKCGGAMREPPAEHPILTCAACGLVIDRDLNAAKNILSRGLRSGHVGSADEVMVGRVSREEETASKVDADHPSNQDGRIRV